MRRETLEEIQKFTPPPKHPSPFATPIVAMVIAGIVGVSAAYANYARGNLFEELDHNNSVNDFEQVVNNSTLPESFADNNWQYTIVAPTDQAFDKAQWRTEGLERTSGQQSLNEAWSVVPGYSNISAYDYVSPAPIYPEDVMFGDEIHVPSLSGGELVFSRVSDGPEGLRINGQPVTTVDYAENGVIYLIDEIIVFPELQQQYSWAQ